MTARGCPASEASLACKIWSLAPDSLDKPPPRKSRRPEAVEEHVPGVKWCPTKGAWRVQKMKNGVRLNKYKPTHTEAAPS